MRQRVRSALYVNPLDADGVERAYASKADALILDLEDSIHPARKDAARSVVTRLLAEDSPKPRIVRINGWTSGHVGADIASLGGLHPACVAVPKVESRDDVQSVVQLLDTFSCDADVWCLLETPIAIERAYEIASAHPRVARISLGEADLKATLGVASDDGLAYVRSRLVCASRAAGLDSPIQSVWLDLGNEAGLIASCAYGRSLGFFGRTVATPRQAELVNEAYTPTAREIEEAREVVAAFDDALAAGTASALLPNGRAIDGPIAQAARHLLTVATEFGC